jgi:hypothetical protein
MGNECLVKPLVGSLLLHRIKLDYILLAEGNGDGRGSSCAKVCVFLALVQRIIRRKGQEVTQLDEVAIDIKKKLHRMPTANYLPDFVAALNPVM